MTFLYRAFGLTLSSELACPALPRGTGLPDAFVRLGPVPPTLTGATASSTFFQATREQCLLQLEQVAGARFLIRDGQDVVIDPQADADERTVRLYLLGAAMAALLYQRDILPFHGSAVAIGSAAALLVGPSGAGKSTLAALLARRGHPILTDDLCAVTLDAEGRPLAHPAAPALRLCADALERLRVQTKQLERVWPAEEKYLLPVLCSAGAEPRLVRAVYVLGVARVSRARLRRVGGFESVALLRGQAYRAEIVSALGRQALLFRTVSALAATAAVYLLERPVRGDSAEELAGLVVESWAALPDTDRAKKVLDHGN